jgi:uncharacterized protein YbjT (DUF2867 family)
MENFSNPTNKTAILSGRLESTLSPDRPLQMVATDDVGGFAAMAFDDPEHWYGKAIELAGDEMTMPEAAEMFSQATGRPVKYKRTDLELIKSPDARAMLDWFQREGYKADIPKLREMRPSLMTLDKWLGSSGWDKTTLRSDHMLAGN